MNKIIKNIFILLIIALFIVAFSSSLFTLSLDNLVYVLAIGIDISDDNKMQVSFQFSTPVSASETGSGEKSNAILNTVTASSLSTAINVLNSHIGKQINLSHCKVIIFSEEYAFQGISDEIYTLINNPEVRPTANIVISKCNAKDYIKQTKPELENLISSYYETLANNSKFIGYIPDATIGQFFNSLTSETHEPYAILGGLNSFTPSTDTQTDSQQDYLIKANETTIQAENNVENVGVAVFNGDQLVGELNAIETICFLNIKNEIDRFMISIPDPLNNNNYLDIYLNPLHSSDIKVDSSTQSPYVKVKLQFRGKMYSMSENSKYLSPEVINTISSGCESYLKSMVTDYLYKTSKDYKSDITSIGLYSLQNFFTLKEFNEYGWLENYKNAFFDVDIKTYIDSGMLITET